MVGWEDLEMVQNYAQMVDDLLREPTAHSPVSNLKKLARDYPKKKTRLMILMTPTPARRKTINFANALAGELLDCSGRGAGRLLSDIVDAFLIAGRVECQSVTC